MSASDFHYKADAAEYLHGAARPRRLPWPPVAIALAAIDFTVLALLATAIGHVYYVFVYGDPTMFDTHARLALMMALLLVAVCAIMGGYRLVSLARRRFEPGRLASAFLIGVLMLVAMLFLEKSSDDYSRSVVSISFVVGLPLILAMRYGEVRLLRRLSMAGWLDNERLMLVGSANRIEEISRDRRLAELGFAVAGRAAIARKHGAALDRALDEAAETARRANPDGIVLALPWAERAVLEAAVARFAELPSAIYLDSDPFLRSLSAGRDGPFDRPVGIQIVARPFSRMDLAVKRAFDIATSAVAILLVSPVLVLVALAIRIDSPGPVLFRQQRYGYGRTPFGIYKFRTMRHGGDGRFRQAERNDARITRIGRFLRRTNLDELPQLFNVLMGNMSLVGPRPHPMELDDQFSPLIHHYSRRHRVRPGITGWAQVNGFRGETDTTEKMRARVTYDLYYLNHWSFGLDIRILLMTVLSATAYRNAF